MKRGVPLLVLALLAPSASQAQTLLIRSGQALLGLTTREQVRERFGWRVKSGVEDGRPYDEVRYHGKPYQELEGPGRGMLFVMTCGLSELVLLPRDLCRAGRDVLVGHTIRFHYDGSDRVTSYEIDGEGPYAVAPASSAMQPAPNAPTAGEQQGPGFAAGPN